MIAHAAPPLYSKFEWLNDRSSLRVTGNTNSHYQFWLKKQSNCPDPGYLNASESAFEQSGKRAPVFICLSVSYCWIPTTSQNIQKCLKILFAWNYFRWVNSDNSPSRNYMEVPPTTSERLKEDGIWLKSPVIEIMSVQEWYGQLVWASIFKPLQI
jgi:hypothetical protein